MKKIHFISFLIMLFMFSSCFKDEGNYTYKDVEEIEIANWEENLPSKITYAGVILDIQPDVKTKYQDLEYEWTIWDRDKLENGMSRGTETEIIGTERNLAYEVNLRPGRYRLTYKVTSKENGYAAIVAANLSVETATSRGFYILKETADGNTDIDLHYKDGEPVMENLLQASGEVMEGKPVCLSSVYGAGYIDREDNEIKTTRSIAITTDKGLFNMYNVADLSVIHTQDDIFYDSWPEGEIPYVMTSYGYCNILISSRGCDANYTTEMMPGAGCMSTYSGKGGSSFMMTEGDYFVYYWSNEEEHLESMDQFSMGQSFFGPFNTNGIDTKGMECLACGSSLTTDPVYGYCILKEKSSNARYMLVANLTDNIAEELRPLPADSKMAKATRYAVNAKTANVLYFVYDNQLYGYNLTDYTEADTPYSLEGIGGDETITYLSYQWMEARNDEEYNFTHLIVGTQKGDTYKLYMYNITAGEPRKLVRTVTGEGQLKMTMYMSPLISMYRGDSCSLPN